MCRGEGSEAPNTGKTPASEYLVPHHIRTFDGAVIDPRADLWVLTSQHTRARLNFASIAALTTPEINNSFRGTLVWFVQNESVSSVHNVFDHARRFFSFLFHSCNGVVGRIDAVHILNYRSTLTKNRQWYLGILRPLFKKWAGLKYPGVSKSTIQLLRSLGIPGNEQGKAVLTYDPVNGPLSDCEFAALNDGLNRKHAEGKIALEDYLLVKLDVHFGLRPSQSSLLKVCDFHVERVPQGPTFYFLMISRVKNRRRAREEMVPKPIVKRLGEAFEDHVKKLRESFKGTEEEFLDSPMFSTVEKKRVALRTRRHMMSNDASRRIKRTIARCDVYSERTGKPLAPAPQVLRRSLGSRMAAAGYNEYEIAEALTQRTVTAARKYIQARPDMMERIDKATAFALAPLARAFLGKVIDNQAGATRGSDMESVIFDPTFGKAQGSCGTSAHCDLMAPIACYTCPCFEPWRDGPHEDVLNALIAQRDGLIAKGSERLAENLTRTILACADVVRRCKGE